jgi:hypothetical protein
MGRYIIKITKPRYNFYHTKINSFLFYYEYILLQQPFSTDVNTVGVEFYLAPIYQHPSTTPLESTEPKFIERFRIFIKSKLKLKKLLYKLSNSLIFLIG